MGRWRCPQAAPGAFRSERVWPSGDYCRGRASARPALTGRSSRRYSSSRGRTIRPSVHVTGAVPCDTLAVVPFDRGKTRGVARAPRQFVVWCRCGEPPCGAPRPAETRFRDPGSSKQRRGIQANPQHSSFRSIKRPAGLAVCEPALETPSRRRRRASDIKAPAHQNAP